jgi:hypothetical protein
MDLKAGFSKFDVQLAGEEGPIALEIYATFNLQARDDNSKTIANEAFSLWFSCSAPQFTQELAHFVSASHKT